MLCAYRKTVEATGFMPRCLFKWATGWDCPGCGSQRAFEALLSGRLGEAFTANLLLVPALLYLAFLLACYIFSDVPRMQRLHRAVTSAAALGAIAVITVGWMIARNLLGI